MADRARSRPSLTRVSGDFLVSRVGAGGEALADPGERPSVVAPFGSRVRPPRARHGLVDRPALLERIARSSDIVLVSAPAGYGKTTLLADWAHADGRTAWFTVTAADNDIAALVEGLSGALDTVDPLRPEDRLALLTPGVDGATVLLPRLGRILGERPLPLTIVLDDVHLLEERQSLRALEVLATHLPAGARLVLAGRTAPALEWQRLRTQREVVELGPADLRMSDAEALALLDEAGVSLDGHAATHLIEHAEGWAAGIYIAGLAARGGVEPDRGPASRAATNRQVEEYLHEQVIAGLEPGTRSFLVRTSVLDELDGATCDALLGVTGSGTVLDDLARANLFVVPLEGDDERYRYHHLFAEALQAQLHRTDPAGESELHARASLIFEERGQPGAAIRHARLAGQVDRAAALVWHHTQVMAATGRASTVLQWLQGFDTDNFDEYPELCTSMAFCAITAPETQPVTPWTDIARRHDPTARLPDGTPLGAAVAVIDAIAGEKGIGQMLTDAELALALDDGVRPMTVVARYIVGTALALLGRRDEARVALEQVVADFNAVPAATINAVVQLAVLTYDDGNVAEAERLARRAIAIREHYGVGGQPLQAVTFAIAALVAATQGRDADALDAVNQTRRLVVRIRHLAPWIPVQASLLLARAHLLLDDPEAARQLVDEAAQVLDQLPDPGCLSAELERVRRLVPEPRRPVAALVVPLTTAELRVLAYLPTHLSYQGIAEDLYVSRNTVKSHTVAIYRKLGVASRPDAVDRARALGLLDERS